MTGIVMMGGMSSRMGTEKASLLWQGQPMYRHCYQLLSGICKDVFLSAGQHPSVIAESNLPVIYDFAAGEGPMTGLISCFRQTRDALLVLPVDMPLLGKKELQVLIETHTSARGCTAFYDAQAGVYEPLFSIWEPHMLALLEEEYAIGGRSLQAFMKQRKVEKLAFPHQHKLVSANTPGEWQALVAQAQTQA
jgi:molybdopterin-guanine dinucleotide biosynthesis protein A